MPRLDAAKARIEAAGLGWKTTAVGAGLVACTGNRGCKFAASDTKGHALAIARHLDPILDLDQPVNIHLTGCHHSCAQHYIGDIGLLAAKVAVGAEGDQVEGYHLHAGGGFGSGCRNRPTGLFGRPGGKGAAARRGTPPRLSRTPRFAGRELRRFLAPA